MVGSTTFLTKFVNDAFCGQRGTDIKQGCGGQQ